MLEIIFMCIGIFFLFTTGLGYILLNYMILFSLEILGIVFGGFIGFIIIGTIIGWVLEKFNKHI